MSPLLFPDRSLDPAISPARSPQPAISISPLPTTAVDSGVNENVTAQFPGSTVQVGGTKRGENPVIPDEEGGELNKASGR